MPVIGRTEIGFDKFYTKPETVEFCLTQSDFRIYDCVIEPSAGAGAFLGDFYGDAEIIAMDVAPESDSVMKQDFLEYDFPADKERILVIGNPPFGARHRLSDAFLHKCFAADNVAAVAFILPDTYRKPSRQKIISDEWRIAVMERLKENSFVSDGNDYHVPCSFFVFDRLDGEDLRFDVEKYRESPDFQFSDSSDFDLFVFGTGPNRITENPLPNNRGYYLKSLIPVAELKRRFQSIDWQGNSCASGGVAWFSRPEIIKGYEDFRQVL